MFPPHGTKDVSVDTMLMITFTEDDNPVIVDAGQDVALQGYEIDCTTRNEDADRAVSLLGADGSVVVNDGAIYYR